MNNSATLNHQPPTTNHPNFDFLYDKEYYGKDIYTNCLLNKKLTYRIVPNCFITPSDEGREDRLFDERGNYITGSDFREELDPLRSIEDNSRTFTCPDLANAKHLNGKFIYIGSLLGAWGHFLTDSMRLLWFLQSSDYKENFSQCKLLYHTDKGFKLQGSYKRLLEIIGVDLSLLVHITELTQCETVIIPEPCFFMSNQDRQVSREAVRFFTPEYTQLINCIRDFAITNRKPLSSKKFYFSYSKYRNNKSVGEDKLEKYFASKGYQIIYPEKLSFDDQLNILANTESFASTSGSLSHNIIFLRDDTEVILIPRTNYLTSYQLALDQVHKLNISYIDSSFSIFVDKLSLIGPFLFFISSNLRQFFHDDNITSMIDTSDFRKYLHIIMGATFSREFGMSRNVDNSDAYRYYSTTAPEYLGYIFSHSWPSRAWPIKITLAALKKVKGIIRKLLG